MLRRTFSRVMVVCTALFLVFAGISAAEGPVPRAVPAVHARVAPGSAPAPDAEPDPRPSSSSELDAPAEPWDTRLRTPSSGAPAHPLYVRPPVRAQGITRNVWSYMSIQATIDIASAGDTIIVWPGTYYENITLKDGVDVTSEMGPNSTFIDGDGSGTVVTASGIGAGTRFEGFWIKNGDADGNGGGMRIVNNSSLTVEHCFFINNDADDYGGGIYVNNSSPTLRFCTINDNDAYHGGGLYCINGSDPVLTNCFFNDNEATYFGGGMFIRGGSSTMTNCYFEGNRISRFDYSPDEQGGGLYNYLSRADLNNCHFTDNYAEVNGGGVYNGCDSPSQFQSCTFTSNDSDHGAGVYNIDSSPAFTDCVFSSNDADLWGGGVYSEGSTSTPTFVSCDRASRRRIRGRSVSCRLGLRLAGLHV